MSDPNIEAMRAAVARDADRTLAEPELYEALVLYGFCRTCHAPRTSKMTEPEPGTFQLDMVCTADPEHDC